MADETLGPKDATAPLPTPRDRETAPGRMINMAVFEKVFAGPDAAGPVLEWSLRWQDGRALLVDGEDEALFLARHNPTCRIRRRFVAPWRRREAGPG